MTPATSPARRGRFLGAAAAIVAAGALVRILAARNDLWLDEIWSLNLVRGTSSLLGVLTEINHDNNHYMNGLFLYLFRDHGNWAGFRALSVLAGIGTVILAGALGRRGGEREALTAMAVTASSYVLILYASEARGYAPMLFFALATFAALRRYLDRPSVALAALSSACAVLGILSHLLFVHFYSAAFAWTIAALWRRRPATRAWIADAARLHAIPALVGAAVYLLRVKGMTVGGGVGGEMDRSALAVYFDSLGWTLAPPPGAAWHVAAAVAAVVILVVGVWRLRDREERILFGGAIAVAPFLFFVAWPVVPYVRYFLVPVTFLLLLLAARLSALWERGSVGRVAYALGLAALVAANARPVAGLLAHGRGDKVGALARIAGRTAGPEITIASDHDLRVKLELEFHAREGFGGRGYAYYVAGAIPPRGPEWLILHTEPFATALPKRELVDPNGNLYRLEDSVATTELSGLPWLVYHNARFGS